MRKFKEVSAIILVLLSLVAITYGIDAVYTANRAGAIVQPGQAHTAQIAWEVVDATTAADNEPNDLATDGYTTYELVVAAIAAASSASDSCGEISLYTIPTSFNAARFRVIGTTNGGTATYQIYLGTLGPGGTNCELAKAGQLAFVMGTQASATTDYEVADTLTVTAYCWPKTWGSASPVGNLCAEATLDLLGADILVAVPTTVSADCKLLIKGF